WGLFKKLQQATLLALQAGIELLNCLNTADNAHLLCILCTRRDRLSLVELADIYSVLKQESNLALIIENRRVGSTPMPFNPAAFAAGLGWQPVRHPGQNV